MISAAHALKLIKKNAPTAKTETIILRDALDRILAEDIRSRISLPVMTNSAMDGYLIRSEDTQKATPEKNTHLKVYRTIKAGDAPKGKLRRGEALRIMTGASVIAGGDTVLPKEMAQLDGDTLFFEKSYPKNKHLRRKGEEVRKGQRLLTKNSVIHPGTIAVLASIGLNKLKVYKKPRVAVVTTGSELRSPGRRLKSGEIYNSNSWMIRALSQFAGVTIAYHRTVKDEPRKIHKALSKALSLSDIVIVAGGVSVGDYDYVKDILKGLKVGQIFWRIDQKPGKPLYFGKRGKKLVFGLPGNPASAYICFYEYIYPALKVASGHGRIDMPGEYAVIDQDVFLGKRKTHFLKACIYKKGKENRAKIFKHQGSHMVSSLHAADYLMVLHARPGKSTVKKGERVLLHRLPHQSVNWG